MDFNAMLRDEKGKKRVREGFMRGSSKGIVKKALLGSMIAILLMAVILTPLATATPVTQGTQVRTWVVGGGIGADFHSIQMAINGARAGDTILVRPGFYFENLDINKPLTIRSEAGPVATVIQAINSNDHVVTITSDNVSISGFGVEGAMGWYRAGIFLQGNSVSVSGNILQDNWIGVDIKQGRNNRVTGNTMSDNCVGISLSHATSNMISNNRVFDAWTAGIYLFHSDKNEVTANHASDNDRGIFLRNSNNNNISNNTCLENVIGIFLQSSHHNAVINNDLTNNMQAGLTLRDSHSNKLSGNITRNIWI